MRTGIRVATAAMLTSGAVGAYIVQHRDSVSHQRDSGDPLSDDPLDKAVLAALERDHVPGVSCWC